MTGAKAAKEASKEEKNITVPSWRTFKSREHLNEKYPGGVETNK